MGAVDLSAYVSALINQPWAPDELHCARLVEDVQRDLFGRTVPAVLVVPRDPRERARLIASHPARADWREVPAPVHGAIVILDRRARPGEGIHVGVYLAIDGGGVLHSSAPHGVVFDTLAELEARRWVPTFLVPKE